MSYTQTPEENTQTLISNKQDILIHQYNETLKQYFKCLNWIKKHPRNQYDIKQTLRHVSLKSQFIEDNLSQYSMIKYVIKNMQPEKYASNRIWTNENDTSAYEINSGI